MDYRSPAVISAVRARAGVTLSTIACSEWSASARMNLLVSPILPSNTPTVSSRSYTTITTHHQLHEFLPKPQGPQGGADLRFLSPQPDTRHQLTLPDHGYGASASCGEPVYFQAFAGTHCAYPRRGGQAELAWVAGCIPRQTRYACSKFQFCP